MSTVTPSTTPLHDALRKGDKPTCKRLIKSRKYLMCKDSEGNTPLHLAAQKMPPMHVRILIVGNLRQKNNYLKQNPSLYNDANEQKIRDKSRKEFLNAKNKKGETPLHKAIEADAHEVACALIVWWWADVNAKHPSGWTPLHYATWKNSHAVAKLLIKKCKDINARDEMGETPLGVATRHKSTEVSALLRQHGATE